MEKGERENAVGRKDGAGSYSKSVGGNYVSGSCCSRRRYRKGHV